MEQFLTPAWLASYIFFGLALVLAFKFRKRMQGKTSLLEGSEASGIFRYTMPLIAGAFFNQFYNLVDSIIVGKYLGSEALAAVGISGTLIWFVSSFFGGLAMGVGVVVAQHYGSRQEDNIKKAADTAYILFLVLGLAATVFGVFFSRPILEALKTPEAILDNATAYTQVFFSGAVALIMYYAAYTVFQSIGDSVTPFLMVLVSTVINIVLDLYFVVVLNMGVGGAALATVISEGVAAAGCFVVLANHKNPALRFNLFRLSFSLDMARQALKIGVPSGLQQSVSSAAFLLQSRLINSFGAAAAAAYSAVSRADGILLLPAYNFAGAVSTFVGQNIGAGRIDRAKRGVVSGVVMTTLFSLALALPAIVFSRELMLIFVNANEMQTIAYGQAFARLVFWSYPLAALYFLFNSAVRGAGQAMAPLIISLIALWGIRLPMAYILSTPAGWGINGVWFSSSLQWISGALIGGLYFAFGKWKIKALAGTPQT